MHRPSLRRLAVAIALACSAIPATFASPASAGIGPDYVSSDNLELVNRLKTTGDGVGGRIVGDYLYVTSTKSLEIYDIAKDPENPTLMNTTTLDVEFENEEVPTNGKILGISGEIGCHPQGFVEDPTAINPTGTLNCLTLWDVTNKATPTYIHSVIGAGDHTQTCVYDCTYFYGSNGTIVDARDPKTAKIIGNWIDGIGEEAGGSCHHVREIQPGIVLASCQPTTLFSVRPEDGGSILKPVIISTGTNEDKRFIHSSRWPRDGHDKFVLSGGETNASPQCDDTVGAFMVWDASTSRDEGAGFRKGTFTLMDEVRPSNGQYIDGHSPYNGLGCSVHWFMNHPTFHDGGVVALAEYENGTRILQITPQGKIIEQGFFLPLAGSTSAPHWHPNGKVIYAVDYTRGVDVLRYTGDTYVPAGSTVTPTPGATPGTGGATAGTSGAACEQASGFKAAGAKGSGRGVKFNVSKRQARPFTVDVFQQSAGRKVLDNELRARFKARRASFAWDGRGARVSDGRYLVRFTMALAGGKSDVRYVTLVRKDGRFKVAKDSVQRSSCGVFSTFRLSSAAFGGTKNKMLGISYRLARGANSVRIEAFAGKRRLRTFTGGGAAGKAYSFRLSPRDIGRGTIVTIRATVQQGSPVGATQLYAVRL